MLLAPLQSLPFINHKFSFFRDFNRTNITHILNSQIISGALRAIVESNYLFDKFVTRKKATLLYQVILSLSAQSHLSNTTVRYMVGQVECGLAKRLAFLSRP